MTNSCLWQNKSIYIGNRDQINVSATIWEKICFVKCYYLSNNTSLNLISEFEKVNILRPLLVNHLAWSLGVLSTTRYRNLTVVAIDRNR